MNWAIAIERHRQPLLRIVAALYAMIGLADGGTIERLSWPLYRAVLSVLRPAESAVRRLIAVAARGLVAKPPAARAAPAGLVISGKGKGRLGFRLFEPQTGHDGGDDRHMPASLASRLCIRVLDVDFDPRIPLFRQIAPPAPPPEPAPAPADTVSAVPLCRRLAAIRCALKDLARQARRYAKLIAGRRPQRDTLRRRGPPPGLRRKPGHEVHAILSECDWLARAALAPNTS